MLLATCWCLTRCCSKLGLHMFLLLYPYFFSHIMVDASSSGWRWKSLKVPWVGENGDTWWWSTKREEEYIFFFLRSGHRKQVALQRRDFRGTMWSQSGRESEAWGNNINFHDEVHWNDHVMNSTIHPFCYSVAIENDKDGGSIWLVFRKLDLSRN